MAEELPTIVGPPDDRPWTAGELVNRYTLLAKIATGGMAEIWLARQAGPRGFEKVVVIKRIVETYSHDPDFVEMFLDEARIAAQLNHPNIVQIYDLGQHHGAWYIAMEYLPGENLAAIVRAASRHGFPIDYQIAARIISSVCEGLFHAHTKRSANGQPLGIVHRDVSPQNVIVTYDGQVKVVDFGIARAANRSSVTAGGQIKGKFAYMAPEQGAGRVVDARGDLFSLGVIFYEMVTRQRLFHSDDQFQTLSAVISSAPVEPANVRDPKVPAGLSEVIARALEKSPERRYPNARAFQAAIESWLQSEGASPGPAELSALMGTLFTDRMTSRARLIEQASKGELTPNAASAALKNDTDRSMPGRTRIDITEGSMEVALPPPSRAKWVALPIAALALVSVGYAMTRVMHAPEQPIPKAATVSIEAPAPTALLIVETDPAGATISLDGADRGKSPVVLDAMPLGSHQIVASLDGRQSVTRTVTLSQNGERSTVVLALSANLAPPVEIAKPVSLARGRLTLSTQPWTHVTLNGRSLGDTPLVEVVLPVGRFTLKLTNEDRQVNETIEVEIKAGQTTTKKLSL